MISNRRKIAIGAVSTTAAGALCLGMAGPAAACESGSHGSDSHGSATTVSAVSTVTAPTFDQKKAWALSFADFWQSYIAAVAQVVAGSDLFTDTQKATFATKAAMAEQQLTDLKAAIAAATTADELRAALRHGWATFRWPGLGLKHHFSKHSNFALLASLLKTPKALSYAKSHPTAYAAAYKSAKAYQHVTLKHHHSGSHN
jgi:hypothetical protein